MYPSLKVKTPLSLLKLPSSLSPIPMQTFTNIKTLSHIILYTNLLHIPQTLELSSLNPTMSSSSCFSRHRKLIMNHPVVVDLGCSCGSRRRSKLFSLFSSLNISRSKSTPGELMISNPTYNKKKQQQKRKVQVVKESVAVVKESTEPYVDFRESMVQMIVEEELYAWDDLNNLLHRFLSLNSPQHHHLILGAFADIWDAVFSG